MEPSQILDKIQILCSHTHTSTVKWYLCFLWVYSPASNLSLSYTHIQISFPFSVEQIVAKGELFLQVCSPHFTVLQKFQ